MLLVDTNVLVDVVERDPAWSGWSVAQMRAQARIQKLIINPVIYAELSLAFGTVAALDDVLSELELTLEEVPRPALFLAGRAFRRYRQRGGNKSNVLADFSIGAHASVCGHTLLTRDRGRYAAYFPGLHLISPPA